MKKLSPLIALLFSAVCAHAAVVQGTVVNMSSSAVAGQIVHVTDTVGGVQAFSLADTTDASGNYSIAIPASTPTGALLHVFTEKCGLKSVSLQTWGGSSLSVNFTVCGTTASGDTVSGKVTYVSPAGNPAFPAIVYLIRRSYNAGTSSYVLSALDSTNTASNGEYHFYGVTVSANDLLVKAALLPSNSNYNNYLPTYKENSLTWSGAHAVSFTPGANDIHMVAGTNPGGPGFIGGSVLLGANKASGTGDPLNNRIVLLTTDADMAVAYTYSNASGSFSFGSLAYGTYKLFGDAWGKDNPPIYVTIDAAHPTVGNIVFQENSKSFSALAVTNPAVFGNVSVYPNPVRDVLEISGMDAIKGVKTISVLNMLGATVMSTSTSGAKLSMSVNQLTAGIYQLYILSGEGAASFRLVRDH